MESIDAVIHPTGKAHNTKNKNEVQVYFDIAMTPFTPLQH
jgi:hypothetical protein